MRVWRDDCHADSARCSCWLVVRAVPEDAGSPWSRPRTSATV